MRTAFVDIDIFIDVIKDRIEDWISCHNCQPDRNLVHIRNLNFIQKVSGNAYATYDEKNWGNYYFCVSFDMNKEGVYLDVYENSVERCAWVTHKWNGFTYLGFDKKGYSYELTKEEYYYLEAAHQRMSLEDVKKFGVTFNDASKLFKDFRKGGH